VADLSFITQQGSRATGGIRDDLPAGVAAEHRLKANPAVIPRWPAGVTTLDAPPVPGAVGAAGERADRVSFEHWMSDHKIPVGDRVAVMIEYVKSHGRVLFEAVSTLIRGSVDGLTALLRFIPSPLLILGAAALSFVLRRSLPLALFVLAALLFIMNQGYWQATLETLSLVIIAALVSTLIGVPVGIAAAHRPRLYAALRPVLDLMQTLPTFVYLIPTLVLFGLGVVPGLISTVIFAVPAPIRLTQLGATPSQLLWKVELPSAAPTILAGITQCIMLSLSMVVIAALVGAGGLGVPVVRALNTVQIGMGFEAGFVIVLLAIVLDRMSRPADKVAA
jgi:ABC-type proline/glycine betaine transport system permease subunit